MLLLLWKKVSRGVKSELMELLLIYCSIATSDSVETSHRQVSLMLLVDGSAVAFPDRDVALTRGTARDDSHSLGTVICIYFGNVDHFQANMRANISTLKNRTDASDSLIVPVFLLLFVVT
jgi:hypothetical protein